MAMDKRGLVIGLFLALVFIVSSVSSVSAVSLTLENVNSTLAQVSIFSAVNLYSYEVNLGYTGNVGAVSFSNFLASDGASTTKGSTTRSSTLSVYESRLDNLRRGISGSGSLFNVVHTAGDLSLSSALLVYNDSTEQEITYSNGGGGTGGSSGGSSGGGSSGGGGFAGTSSLISFDSNTLHVKIKPGESLQNSVVITNDNNVNMLLGFDLSLIGDFVALGDDSLLVPAGESRSLNLDFFAAEDTPLGIYTGRILVYYNNVQIDSINVIIDVVDKLPLFDISSTLDSNEYLFNDKITSRIKMTNIGDLSKVDVILRYSIKDFEGNEYNLGEETVGVDGIQEIIRIFNLPGRLPLGDYTFNVKLTTLDGQVATSSSPFAVVGKLSFSFYNLRYYIVAAAVLAMIILIGIISYIEARRSSKKNKLRGHYLLRERPRHKRK